MISAEAEALVLGAVLFLLALITGLFLHSLF